jgi:hypothetical protein
MNNSDDIKDHPELNEAIRQSVALLLHAYQKTVFKNPCIDCIVNMDDGKKYTLKFEQIDLD